MQLDYNVLITGVIGLLGAIIGGAIAIIVANRNRKDVLVREEYFKLKQVAERIVSKLIILERDREKLKVYVESQFKVSQDKNSVFLDVNDTFNFTDFNRDTGEVAALIEIYFPNIKIDWNYCVEQMRRLTTLTLILNERINKREIINWEKGMGEFKKISEELGDRPKLISDKIKEELIEFKKNNL